MNGNANILFYKGEPELERDICHIIPVLKFPRFGPVPEDYAEREKLAEYVFDGVICRGGYFLTAKGRQWIRDHAPKQPEEVVEGQVVCAYCRTARKSTDKDGNPTTCKGCGATEARGV